MKITARMSGKLRGRALALLERCAPVVSRLRARPAGQGWGLVEFALTLPVSLMLIFGILDLGRAVVTYNLIAETARAGARAGLVKYDANAMIAAARAEGGQLADSYTVSPSASADAFGPFVEVVVTASFQPFSGQILGVGSIPLSATSRTYLPGSPGTLGPTATSTTPPGSTPTVYCDTTGNGSCKENQPPGCTCPPTPTATSTPTATPTPLPCNTCYWQNKNKYVCVDDPPGCEWWEPPNQPS